jgi:hypothetical protein
MLYRKVVGVSVGVIRNTQINCVGAMQTV